MKKILFLLLITVASYGQTLQNPTFGSVKVKQNVTSVTAPFVNVQETDGLVNKINKADLVDAIIVNTTAELTTSIGNINKLYATRDNTTIYRYNGTIYVPLIQDISGKEDVANRGIPNGYASLDSSGKVPLIQINDALLGAVNYKGTYNASTNTPTLPTVSSGNKGHYYIVSTAGVQAGLTLNIGDWIISNGIVWGKVDNNNSITSVNGLVGSVVLTTSNVNDTTNRRYQTDLQQTNNDATSSIQTQLNSKQNTLINPITGTGTIGFVPTFVGGSEISNSKAFFDSNGLNYKEPESALYSAFTTPNNNSTSFLQFGVYNTTNANANKAFMFGGGNVTEIGTYIGGIKKLNVQSNLVSIFTDLNVSGQSYFNANILGLYGANLNLFSDEGLTSKFSVNGGTGNIITTGKITANTAPTNANDVVRKTELDLKQNTITGTANVVPKFGTGGLVGSTLSDNGAKISTGSNLLVTNKWQIDEYGFSDFQTESNNGGVNLNFFGFNAGSQYFRDLTFYNGKAGNIGSLRGSTGNLLLNTNVDNLTDKIQVNGTVKASNGQLVGGTGTTNEIPFWSASNTLGTLPIATYPSLSELANVKGLSNPIQAQLNGKVSNQATNGYLTQYNGSVLVNSPLSNNSGTLNYDSSVPLFTSLLNGTEIGNIGTPNIFGGASTNDYMVRSINNMRFYTAFSEKMRLATNGNLGIGTDNPSEKLDVNGNARFAVGSSTAGDITGTISIGGDAIRTSDGRYTTAIKSINTDTTPNFLNPRMGLFTQGTGTFLPSGLVERVSILADNGNVGIGTTNPLLNLQLNSTLGTNSTFAFSENNVLKWYNRYNSSNGNYEIVDVANTLTRFSITNTGIVKVSNLAGTGTRTVVADASGNLSTVASSSGDAVLLTGNQTITNGIKTFTNSNNGSIIVNTTNAASNSGVSGGGLISNVESGGNQVALRLQNLGNYPAQYIDNRNNDALNINVTNTGTGIRITNDGSGINTYSIVNVRGGTANFSVDRTGRVSAPNIPIQLKDFSIVANNTGTTETDLYSYTVDSNRLNATGEKIIASYAGTFNDVSASSQIRVYFANTLIGDTGALTMSTTGAFVLTVSIMRTGATTSTAIVNITTPGASTATYTKYTPFTGEFFDNAKILKITGTAAGATGGSGDISSVYGNILWQPAAL